MCRAVGAPPDCLHRGGRAARAGESGSGVNPALPQQCRDMDRLRPTPASLRSPPRSAPARPHRAASPALRLPPEFPVTITVPAVEHAEHSGSATAAAAAAPPRPDVPQAPHEPRPISPTGRAR
ncbi:hypothetical protein GCM10010211_45920 [Streptomyces albospinus]|uniref:Uncharacterized protein n=1 Tax=Streptomyces albospinus TaxID=285515 RepID=A0ABQ2VCR8_9ACTN|nr:hypothetical protein GCM10010211_45920 [Streptomyces albospinus]